MFGESVGRWFVGKFKLSCVFLKCRVVRLVYQAGCAGFERDVQTFR